MKRIVLKRIVMVLFAFALGAAGAWAQTTATANSNNWSIRNGHLTINNGVTAIGNYAFVNRQLTSVTIPDSVIDIDRGAFANCTSLTSVTFERSDTSINGVAFPGDLQSVYLDEGPGTYTRASGGTVWAREAHGARG